MLELSEYELRVASILEVKLTARGLDPSLTTLTQYQISEIEELTKESQDEAKR